MRTVLDGLSLSGRSLVAMVWVAGQLIPRKRERARWQLANWPRILLIGEGGCRASSVQAGGKPVIQDSPQARVQECKRNTIGSSCSWATTPIWTRGCATQNEQECKSSPLYGPWSSDANRCQPCTWQRWAQPLARGIPLPCGKADYGIGFINPPWMETVNQ